MTPDPLYTATYPGGTTVSAGVLDGEIVVDGNNVAGVESLTNSVASDLDYVISEGLTAKMNAAWALPDTMRVVLGDEADVKLASGTPTPWPEGTEENPEIPEPGASVANGDPSAYHSDMTPVAAIRAMRDRQPPAGYVNAARDRVRAMLRPAAQPTAPGKA